MTKKLLLLFTALGATGVMLGAFGAHGLKDHLSPERLETYQKGVFYQFVHVLAGILSLLLLLHYNHKLMRLAPWFFAAGILCFSGSLYLLAVRDITGMNHWGWLVPITPLGGVCFITGWLLLFAGLLKSKPGLPEKKQPR